VSVIPTTAWRNILFLAVFLFLGFSDHRVLTTLFGFKMYEVKKKRENYILRKFTICTLRQVLEVIDILKYY
jgi:hypothetical protein